MTVSTTARATPYGVVMDSPFPVTFYTDEWETILDGDHRPCRVGEEPNLE